MSRRDERSTRGGERLQKILARSGYGSRRTCEALIADGRVTVNGKRAHLGQAADRGRDEIAVDGKRIPGRRPRRVIALHKPPGVLSDQGDGSGELPTVTDLVDVPERLFAVGRLDLRSEGLMLLTNDGKLAHVLTHPRYEHEKEYHAFVKGHPKAETLAQWRQGVFLGGTRTAPAEVEITSHKRDGVWLRILLREGRKRQIRRVAALLGHPVQRLIRVRIGPVHLGSLKPREWRPVSEEELAALDRIRAEQRPANDSGGRSR